MEVPLSDVHTLQPIGPESDRETIPSSLSRLSPQYPGNIPRVSVGYRNEVEVDSNSDIHLYDLEHYRGASCWSQPVGFRGGAFHFHPFDSDARIQSTPLPIYSCTHSALQRGDVARGAGHGGADPGEEPAHLLFQLHPAGKQTPGGQSNKVFLLDITADAFFTHTYRAAAWR